MKNIRKLAAITMLLVMVFSMVGCGKKQVANGDELKLGLDDAFPPMGFRDDDQKIVGFDIDVANEVCTRMGKTLTIVPIKWDAKEQELNTKNIDCIWNGMSYNNDRDKTMKLSFPYMKNTQVVVVLNDSPVQTLEDLAGKVVVIQNGSTASDAMDANPDFTNSLKELVKVKDNVQAMMDLKVAGSDAVVMDEVVARYYMEKDEGTYRVLDTTLSDENYVIGFRKEDTELCTQVEEVLTQMAEDGTLATISEKWFGTDLTTVAK